MTMQPEVIDLGVTVFDNEFLREMNDPRADESPDGISIHVVQCADCGAHSNDGEPENIVHNRTCKPGESQKWANFYAKEDDSP